MQYDFKSLPDRWNTGAVKYELMAQAMPEISEKKDVIPFSVADMEFVYPPQIREGLKKRIDQSIFGYTWPTAEYEDAVVRWMERRHQWKVKKEWMVQTPGVVNAFFQSVRAFTQEGDGVIVMPPVYYPFYAAVQKNNRKVVENPLKLEEGRYEIDFDDFEKKARDPNTKALLFCSPHNPVGRVWTKKELEQLADLCIKYDLLILSDEIHFDLVLPGHKHTVFATVDRPIQQQVITFTAPSKTFNLAGLQLANVMIEETGLREQFKEELAKSGQGMLNAIGYEACRIAYDECEDWLEQLIEVVAENHNSLKDFFDMHLPHATVFPLEGTYLQWIDFRKWKLSEKELEEKMQKEARMFLDEGYIFGEAGKGFERINLACPKETLMEGLERIKKAF